jgi:hypothetical protein
MGRSFTVGHRMIRPPYSFSTGPPGDALGGIRLLSAAVAAPERGLSEDLVTWETPALPAVRFFKVL